MYRYVLFDLDGTLSDPKVGICTSVQYALHGMGIEEPDIETLTPFIGPPLRGSFMEFYGMTAEEAEKAIGIYRERFSTIGKFENEIYPGIPELLRDLKKKGKTVAIASSKPTVFVEDILNHFEIREYFDVVVGSELDGTRDTKEEVLDETLRRMFPDGNIEYDEVVMVGDRKFDIEAALKLGVRNIGVSYGYGSREELEEAGADKIVNTVAGLRTTLLPVLGQTPTYQQSTRVVNMSEDGAQNGENTGKEPMDWKTASKEAGKKSFSNTWGFVGPALTYWIGKTAAYYVIIIIISSILGSEEAITEKVPLLTPIVVMAASLIPCLFLLKTFLHMEKVKETPTKRPFWEWIVLGIGLVCAIVGIQGWLHTSGVLTVSEEYATYITQKYDGNLVLLILCYGVMLPLADVFVYSGLVLRRGLKYMKPGMAIVLSALMVGFLNQSSFDGVVCTVCVLAGILCYYRLGNLWFVMALSVVGNIVVTVCEYYDSLFNIVFSGVCTKVLLALAILAFTGIFMLTRPKPEKKEL